MKTTEIRELTDVQINENIASLKEELFNLKFKLAVGQLEQTHRVKEVKKTIARMYTVLSERNV